MNRLITISIPYDSNGGNQHGETVLAILDTIIAVINSKDCMSWSVYHSGYTIRNAHAFRSGDDNHLWRDQNLSSQTEWFRQALKWLSANHGFGWRAGKEVEFCWYSVSYGEEVPC